METKFTREEEEAIVKLWRDNEQEMRCLVWFEKNHPRAVEWARHNWSFMEIRHKGAWQLPWFSQSKSDDAIILRIRPDFKLPEPEKWFYSINRNQLYRCRGGRADKQDSIFGIHCIEDFDSDNYVEVPAEYLEYVKGCIERHNKGEFDLKEYELRRLVKCETVEWISPKSYKSGIGVVYLYDGTLRFIKKPAAKPEWKEVFNNGKIRVEERVK